MYVVSTNTQLVKLQQLFNRPFAVAGANEVINNQFYDYGDNAIL
jgi:hypothetical protein